MAKIRVEVYSHGFRVSKIDWQARYAISDFIKKYVQFGITKVRGRFQRQMLKVYATATNNRSEYWFHVNAYSEFMLHCDHNGIGSHQMDIVQKQVPKGAKATFVVNKKWSPRDYQVPVIKYLTAKQATRVVTLQTGRGKTYCALEAIARIGQRVACVIRGGYVDKWIEDVHKTFDIDKKRIMVVRGEKSLRALIAIAKDGELDVDFIIITSKTMYAFFKAYEQGNGRSIYGCKPHEFYKLIEAGVRLIDEVHEDFHLNFKQDLYTNIAKTISLSATLESKDPFMDRMYDLMFPQNIWYRDGYVRYIDVMSLHYSLRDPNSLNHVARGRGSYSHVEFEKSLIKKPSKLDAYLDMISAAIRKHHIEVAEEGQRVIVFAATIELCTIISDRLSKEFEDKKVARYVSEDNYDVLFENDIISSTLLSAGTAVDIPGLRHVIMTTAIDSIQKNIQALGRLRDLEKQGWEGQTPEFIYLVCDNIPKHVEYHRNKIDAFADKCKSQIAISSGVVI